MADLAAWWQRHMRTRNEPPFLLDAESLNKSADLYRELFSDRLEAAVTDADRVCRGEFSFLGIEFQTGPTIDWQRDPKTNRNWPARFYADVRIPFCDGTGSKGAAGDVKHVWELNRHDFLIDCAKAYYLTREGRFARHVFQIVSDWVDANPYLQGVNWAGPLEVAVRSMNWIWAYQFCRSWEGLSADDHLQLIKGCYQHGVYLYRHLEVYSSPNNHLVGEATALYLLASFFPEFNESATWREKAWRILESQPKEQFYEDGGSTEQATSYHHYCLGFFVLAVLTRMRQELPVPQAMLERVEAAFSFSMWMTTPDGTVPAIGDTDDARSIRFGRVKPWDFRNLLSIGAAIFQRGDMKTVAGSVSEDSVWLLGVKGCAAFLQSPAETPTVMSQVFPDSGYVIMRSGWSSTDHHVCFDCGAIGKDLYTTDIPVFTHGHADLLALTMSVYGKPLLVDCGLDSYNGSPDWHRYCRDIRAHNTVSVDGASHAKFGARNTWSCVAKPEEKRCHSNGRLEIAEGSHCGFFGVREPVRHRRIITWERSEYLVVHDSLDGDGTHTVEVFFHFAPGIAQLLPDRTGARINTEQGVDAVIKAVNLHPLYAEIEQRAEGPTGGWIASSYGRRIPAPLVTFRGQVTLPLTLTFILVYSVSNSTTGENDSPETGDISANVAQDSLALH
jgi:hypothetical protein